MSEADYVAARRQLAQAKRWLLGGLLTGASGPVVFAAVVTVGTESGGLLASLALLCFCGFLGMTSILVHWGERAWRLRGMHSTDEVGHYAADTIMGEDVVSRRLAKAGYPYAKRLHVHERSGIVLNVNGHPLERYVRGAPAATAALTDLSPRPLSELEQIEVRGISRRLRRLRWGKSFVFGFACASVLRWVFGATWIGAWMREWGFIVWWGLGLIALVALRLRAEVRVRRLGRDATGSLVTHGDQLVLPTSGVVWQYGSAPGSLRLERGGLRDPSLRRHLRAAGFPVP